MLCRKMQQLPRSVPNLPAHTPLNLPYKGGKQEIQFLSQSKFPCANIVKKPQEGKQEIQFPPQYIRGGLGWGKTQIYQATAPCLG